MRYTYFVATAILAVAGLQLTGCGKKSSYTKVEPAKVEKADGINKVTLTEKAIERVGVKTAPIQEGKVEGAPEGDAPKPFAPYSAVLYLPMITSGSLIGILRVKKAGAAERFPDAEVEMLSIGVEYRF